jgi:hypothetical protein
MRPWIPLFFVVVFVSGAASGYFVGRSQVTPRTGDVPNRREVLEAFVREVGLDPEQRASFEKVFDTNHSRFVSVKLRVEPELAALRSEVRTHLRGLLRDEQKPRFDQYCNKRDRQRDENMR